MRIVPFVLLSAGLAFAQEAPAPPPDPAYGALTKAYDALRDKNYDVAVSNFVEGISLSSHRADIRKDLAYTYLKIGETDLAREQFGEAMRLQPADTHVALEYGFLCYEAQDRVNHGD